MTTNTHPIVGSVHIGPCADIIEEVTLGHTSKDSAFKHIPGMVEFDNSAVVAVKTHCCYESERDLFIHGKQVER